MKANELRIGNLVNLYGQTATILRNDFGGSGIAIDKGKPIPLTEEWLVKFGFVEDGKTTYGSKYYSMPIMDYKYLFAFADFRNDWGFYQEYTDSPFPTDDGKRHFISCGIKYVHQLQNLYYALLFKELTIN